MNVITNLPPLKQLCKGFSKQQSLCTGQCKYYTQLLRVRSSVGTEPRTLDPKALIQVLQLKESSRLIKLYTWSGHQRGELVSLGYTQTAYSCSPGKQDYACLKHSLSRSPPGMAQLSTMPCTKQWHKCHNPALNIYYFYTITEYKQCLTQTFYMVKSRVSGIRIRKKEKWESKQIGGHKIFLAVQ